MAWGKHVLEDRGNRNWVIGQVRRQAVQQELFVYQQLQGQKQHKMVYHFVNGTPPVPEAHAQRELVGE
tara:strand:+ start:143 stop:346 length:204 start_codon:yes stop_codon:yes gene_type:complete